MATLAGQLARTATAVTQRARYLGLCRVTPRWRSQEDSFLRSNYRRIATRTIADALGRPLGGVHDRAFELGLTRRVPPSRRRPWTREEDDCVKENYGNIRPARIAQSLRRSRGAVHHRAERLGLFSTGGSGEFIRRQALPRTGWPFTGLLDGTDRGYVAGIIDGEGSILGPPRVTLSVTTTTKALAKHLQSVAGGSVSGPYQYQKVKQFGRKRYRLKPQFRWTFSSRYHVYLLLKAVEPYLVVKAAEARRAVRHLERKYGWGPG